MNVKEFMYKFNNKFRKKFIISNWNHDYLKYCKKYNSYRYMKKNVKTFGTKDNIYMTARPNPCAGIGHQMANWIAGYWFAKFFGLKFAHIPFSNVDNPFLANEWDAFLGFGENEVQASQLLEQGWKKVLLPLFDENDKNQIKIIRQIINSYIGKKVIFVLEQDQFYKDQFGIKEVLQKKFYAIHNLKKDKVIYSNYEYNIAVHIRRGDIVQKPGENEPNLTIRWLDNDYFVNALKVALSTIQTTRIKHIYLFSQGKKEDFPEFNQFENVTYCLDMGEKDSFMHMVFSDALITSKSSFSYKPALLNRGLKFCPKDFWHGYPQSEDWIMLSNEGKIINKGVN